MRHGRIAIRMHAGTSQICISIVYIFADMLSCRTIVTVRKVGYHRVHINIRVPKQLGYEKCPEFLELARPCLIISLFKDSYGIVFNEVPDMRLHGPEIGDRQTVEAEIRHIIPDIEIRCDRRPFLHVLCKFQIFLALIISVKQTAFDTAQTDHDIVTRNDTDRSFPGISVCECSHILVRKFLLYRICDLIDKPDHHS